MPEVIVIGESNFNCVTPDYDSIMPSSLKKLLECGYQRIVFVGPVKAHSYHYSYMPFQIFDSWSMKKVKKDIVPTDIDIPEVEWHEQLRKVLKNPEKTAFIAPSFEEARECFYFASESRRNIPDDVGILCLGTKREHSDSGVPFSGDTYSGFALGEVAAKMILERIEKKACICPLPEFPSKKSRKKHSPKNFSLDKRRDIVIQYSQHKNKSYFEIQFLE